MGRPRREVSGGHIYHVLNRGVRKSVLFECSAEYEQFQQLMCRAAQRVSMRVLAYVLMPNHWHLVLWPECDGALSAYVQWLAGTHARSINARYGHVGAAYQRRFTSVPVRDALHLLTVLRYVESNPVRAGLVRDAEAWPWSSATSASAVSLTASPVPRPAPWSDLLADSSLDLFEAARIERPPVRLLRNPITEWGAADQPRTRSC